MHILSTLSLKLWEVCTGLRSVINSFSVLAKEKDDGVNGKEL